MQVSAFAATPVELAKQRLGPVSELLVRHGLWVRGSSTHCPSPEHEDRHPSASIYKNDERVHCHVCDWDGDVIDVAEALGEHVELRGNGGVYSVPRPKPKPSEPDEVMRDLKTVLESRRAWPFEWLVASHLALLSTSLMRQDVLANWDYLTERGDLQLILETTSMIRDVAISRYCSAKNVEDPEAIKRAVARMLVAA
ncbi:MAG: hypothetical protein M3Q18_10385 [Actinomycetota bacterium]|nr:hypothetical protein [Actinomycetota bacterium]